MASALKRKGGPMEVLEVIKRSKSDKGASKSASSFDQSNPGWDAAFAPVKTQALLATVKGSGADGSVIDYEEYVNHPEKHSRSSRTERRTNANSAPWRVSEPIGGRMLNLDPVFTEDEKFIIVAQRASLRVYSTETSLLQRTITFKAPQGAKSDRRIVEYVISPRSPHFIWTCFSDGSINQVDWTTGKGADQSWLASSNGIAHMAVGTVDSADNGRDIVYTTSERETGVWEILASEVVTGGKHPKLNTKAIYTSRQSIHILKASIDSKVLVASSENRILVGRVRSGEISTVETLRYEFYVFESSDFVTSIDVRFVKPPATTKGKQNRAEKVGIVDIIVGDAKGAIFIHNDLLRNLIRSQTGASDEKEPLSLVPRRLHWHRKAVAAVKWSQDGNYIISGGSETVLVFWQLDTGRQQFLPHLSAAIQNIVVSPQGASYAIRLADNSTMIISTSELKPTAHIAGIQAHVVRSDQAPDALVWRVSDESRDNALVQRIPTVINPAVPSQLLLAVGEVQEVEPLSKRILSSPYLQTFDISSGHNISRQALTRTNVTNRNTTPHALPISEPRVTHMKVSRDGKWLATVDEWQPPMRDVGFLKFQSNSKDKQLDRREVYLKFWQWVESDKTWELISRIDSPHSLSLDSSGAGKILDLAVDPSSSSFSTLGEDGTVKIWQPRARRRDNVLVRGGDGQPLYNWACQQSRALPKATSNDEAVSSIDSILQRSEHGCIAYSEDGSILAAASSRSRDRVVHLLDPVAGAIRASHPLLYKGDLLKMEILSQYLIILSGDLRVYDMVLDESQYGVALKKVNYDLSLEQKVEMTHLAVDKASRTFAVAMPCVRTFSTTDSSSGLSMAGAYTELAVFSLDTPEPLLTQTFSQLTTALVAATSIPGYVMLDTTAEVLSIIPSTVQDVTSTARPIVELRLDYRVDDKQAADLIEVEEAVEEPDNQDEMDIVAGDDVDVDDDDDETPLVSQTDLANVFDIGPSFAMPPIEQMFYQVADLFSSKARAQKV